MPIKKVQKRQSMIRAEDVHWFGGKPMSMTENIRWANAVKRDSKKNFQFIANLVPSVPIKGRKRVNEPSILQNLNSSLDLNPFPISKVQDAKNENDLVERQSGARRLRPLTKPQTALQIQTGGKKRVGARKKKIIRR